MLWKTKGPAMVATERFSIERVPYIEGGFGPLVRGRDNELERNVTVKMLDELVTLFSPMDRERFRQRASALARLSHPNIPSVYDLDLSPGRFRIISQAVEGTTLRQILDDHRPIHFGWAGKWFDQIASALEYAHALEVVHGDLKPANIVITPNRESALLVNFGIPLSQADSLLLAKSRVWFGTSEHPRSDHGGPPADPRPDLYALGSTMYEALSGKCICRGSYKELSRANPIIPSETDSLLRACLDPWDRRIANATAFRKQLKAAVIAHRSRMWYPEMTYRGKNAEALAWREHEERQPD